MVRKLVCSDTEHCMISDFRALLVENLLLLDGYSINICPATTIMYDLPETGFTRLLIYDLLGREVVTLVKKDMKAGYYSTRWDGRNQYGQNVGAGMYFYYLQSGPYRKSLKMLLVK